MAVCRTLVRCCCVLSFGAVHSQDFLQPHPRVGSSVSTLTALAPHEVLNTFYKNGTGLLVSMMHGAFEDDSLAKGVPVWSCPSGDEKCNWHRGHWYASTSWISWDLYGGFGVELYGCNPSSCNTTKLVLIYNPKTTVVGSAFIADGNTDGDVIGDKHMEGCSKVFNPPPCSEVYHVCINLTEPGRDQVTMASCLKQAGGHIGQPFHDSFSDAYGGVLEGTLLPYDAKDSSSNFTRFVDLQKESLSIVQNGDFFPEDCEKAYPGLLNSSSCPVNTTCNAGGFGYNELPIRAANPKDVCAEGRCDPIEYQDGYCKNQLPIALAYVTGSRNDSFDPETNKYYKWYVAQIKEICNLSLPLVRFNFTNKDTQPFVAFESE